MPISGLYRHKRPESYDMTSPSDDSQEESPEIDPSKCTDVRLSYLQQHPYQIGSLRSFVARVGLAVKHIFKRSH